MIYQRRADTIEAHRVSTGADAAQVTGWTPAADDDGWSVESSDGLSLSGHDGDYLIPAGSSWRVIPAAEFEAAWMLPPADWAAEADRIVAAADGIAEIATAVDAASTALGKMLAMRGLLPHVTALAAGLRAVLATYQGEG